MQTNYEGDWTALFCAGSTMEIQPPPPFNDLYRFQNTRGFDGQFYYLIAHDPFMRKGLVNYVEWPGLRYRRILVPLLAHVLALVIPAAIATTYIAVNVIFLLLGAWWTARYAALHNSRPEWAFAFMLVPAVLVSLDRLTVDLAFVSLSVGVAYYWKTGEFGKLVAVLALLCLTRETGLVVAVAFLIFCLLRGQKHRAKLVVLSTLPFLAWSVYVNSLHPPLFSNWVPKNPFSWTINAILSPSPYDRSPAISLIVQGIDLAALAGLALGVWLSLRQVRKGATGPVELACFLFALLGIYLLSLDGWTHVYDFGRVLSPMAAFLVLGGIASGHWWMLLPAAMMTLRVGVQLAPQLLRILSS